MTTSAGCPAHWLTRLGPLTATSGSSASVGAAVPLGAAEASSVGGCVGESVGDRVGGSVGGAAEAPSIAASVSKTTAFPAWEKPERSSNSAPTAISAPRRESATLAPKYANGCAFGASTVAWKDHSFPAAPRRYTCTAPSSPLPESLAPTAATVSPMAQAPPKSLLCATGARSVASARHPLSLRAKTRAAPALLTDGSERSRPAAPTRTRPPPTATQLPKASRCFGEGISSAASRAHAPSSARRKTYALPAKPAPPLSSPAAPTARIPSASESATAAPKAAFTSVLLLSRVGPSSHAPPS